MKLTQNKYVECLNVYFHNLGFYVTNRYKHSSLFVFFNSDVLHLFSLREEAPNTA